MDRRLCSRILAVHGQLGRTVKTGVSLISTALEGRIPLLEERFSALALVCRPEQERTCDPLEIESPLVVQPAVDRLLRQSNRQRSVRRDGCCQFADGVVERTLVVDAIDDTEIRSLLGVDRAAGEDEVLRDAGTRDVSEALGAATAGKDPGPTIASGVATRRSQASETSSSPPKA